MTEFGRLPRGEETDLLCVEVSALGQAPMPAAAALPKMSRGGWQQQEQQQQKHEEEEEEERREVPMSGADQAHEDFLTSMLLRTDAYRPLQTSLLCMEDPEFLDMRGAVVNWFAKVSVSYNFANETVVAALSHFDRYVSLTVTPVNDHMLLQLAAYVALLIASKMSETCPLRMKSLANLTGRMFTPLQVKRLEMDMISKLNFRLAPPSADETLHCLSTLLHNNSSSSSSRVSSSSPAGAVGGVAVPHAEILSAGSYYLKKARARTCWFRHSPYTLAVAALATAYNSMGLGRQRRRLLRECDARARVVTGRGLDIHGVAACADAMANDARASEAVAAATLKRQARGSTESPVCGGGGKEAVKEGWGSPTGVAQGAAELLQKAAFAAVGGGRDGGGGGGGVPLVEDFSPPRTFSPCGAVPTKAAASHVVAGRRVIRRVSSSPRATAPRPRVSTSPRDIVAPTGAAGAGAAPAQQVSVSTSPLDVERITAAPAARPRRVSSANACSQQYLELAEASRRQSSSGRGGVGHKRRLHQSEGSCFVPCARRRSVEGKVGRGADVGREELAEQVRQHQDLNAVRERDSEYGYASSTNTQQRVGRGSGQTTAGRHQQQQQQQQQLRQLLKGSVLRHERRCPMIRPLVYEDSSAPLASVRLSPGQGRQHCRGAIGGVGLKQERRRSEAPTDKASFQSDHDGWMEAWISCALQVRQQEVKEKAFPPTIETSQGGGGGRSEAGDDRDYDDSGDSGHCPCGRETAPTRPHSAAGVMGRRSGGGGGVPCVSTNDGGGSGGTKNTRRKGGVPYRLAWNDEVREGADAAVVACRRTAADSGEVTSAVERDARSLRSNKGGAAAAAAAAAEAAAVKGRGDPKAAGAGLTVQLPRPGAGDEVSSTTPGGEGDLVHGNSGFGCSWTSGALDSEWGLQQQQQQQQHSALEESRTSMSRVVANLRASVASNARPSSAIAYTSSDFCAKPWTADLQGSDAVHADGHEEVQRGVSTPGITVFSTDSGPCGGSNKNDRSRAIGRPRPQSAAASSSATGRFSLSSGGASGGGRSCGATPTSARVITNLSLFGDDAAGGKAVTATRRHPPSEGQRGGTTNRFGGNQQQKSLRRPKSAAGASSADRRGRAVRAPSDYSFFPSPPPVAVENVAKRRPRFDGGHGHGHGHARQVLTGGSPKGDVEAGAVWH
eukprot:g12793.t1